MENINTAYNLVHLIQGLPKTLWSLPVCYDDCDCGRGPHAVNSLYPDRDHAGNIYLRPSSGHYQVTDILEEYNRLKKENDDIALRAEKAKTDGVEIINFTSEPYGWNRIFGDGPIHGHCDKDFDPDNPDYKNYLIEICKAGLLKPLRKNCELIGLELPWNMFLGGSPGNRKYLRFFLDELNITMNVIDSQLAKDVLIGDFIYLTLHFDIQYIWKPDVSKDSSWKELGYQYDRREIYSLNQKLVFEVQKQKSK